MATVALANDAVTQVLAGQRDSKMVWFQNFNTGTGAGVYLMAKQMFPGTATPSFSTAEFYVPPATDAQHPGYFALDTPGLCDYSWFAYQNSGGSININAGREYGGAPRDTVPGA